MNRHFADEPVFARSGLSSLLGLLAFVVLCLGASWVAGWATSTSVATWYPTLEKPWYTPPDGAFAPVWLALYLLMAVAGWRVWRRVGFTEGGVLALGLFALQLVLNVLWPLLFFGLQEIGWALLEIALLALAILATTVAFWRIDRGAGILMLPYLAWVAFAGLLNLGFWRLN